MVASVVCGMGAWAHVCRLGAGNQDRALMFVVERGDGLGGFLFCGVVEAEDESCSDEPLADYLLRLAASSVHLPVSSSLSLFLSSFEISPTAQAERCTRGGLGRRYLRCT